MKTYSITRRVVLMVLLCELVLTGVMSVAAVLYMRHQQLLSFEVMLRGRADSVFGAVGDADDENDSLVLDTHAFDLPKHDVYEVVEDKGPLLGRSYNWQGMPAETSVSKDGSFSFEMHGRHYRGVRLHALRSIDTGEKGGGVQYWVTVYYASPTKPIEEVLWRSVKFFGFTDLFLMLGTGIMLVWLLRRAILPLRTLAARAAMVNAQSLSFKAPQEAYNIKELAPLASALDTAMRGIERAFIQQRDFLSDAAHELKTAVTLVKSSLQLLESRKRTVNEYVEGLELCLADCERMEELVMKMLMLARIERINLQGAHPAHTLLKECIADVATQVESLAMLRRVHVEVIAPGELTVGVAVDDAENLLKNLLLNAIQHSKPSSIVSICTKEQDGRARITVTDEGEGIASKHLSRIFDRFYRGDDSRSRNTGGTGLGLAICKAIVDAYRGSIEIESRVGEGTTVIVYLPMALSTVPETVNQIKFS
jgi:signal transduction histidine kinase